MISIKFMDELLDAVSNSWMNWRMKWMWMNGWMKWMWMNGFNGICMYTIWMDVNIDIDVDGRGWICMYTYLHTVKTWDIAYITHYSWINSFKYCMPKCHSRGQDMGYHIHHTSHMYEYIYIYICIQLRHGISHTSHVTPTYITRYSHIYYILNMGWVLGVCCSHMTSHATPTWAEWYDIQPTLHTEHGLSTRSVLLQLRHTPTYITRYSHMVMYYIELGACCARLVGSLKL